MAPISSVPALAANAVHVWRIPLAVTPGEAAACEAMLSDEERARAKRLQRPRHRRQFAAAHGNMRRLLGLYLQTPPASLPFTRGRAGKPATDGLQFNLSHSGDWALLAVSREMVGIDLEEIRELDYLSVGRPLLPDQAMVEIERSNPRDRGALFFWHWVRHEARLKAFGSGLGEACPEIPVHELDAGRRYAAALATPILNPTIEILGPPIE